MDDPSLRFFDNASTTQVDSRVVEAMAPYWSDIFANPSSQHSMGQRARAAVESSRELMASLLGAEDPSQIIFTSGATESNNWALSLQDQLQVGPFEHASIREPAARRHAEVLRDFPKSVHQGCLASWMWINNETGEMWNLPEIAMSGGQFHSDITQGAFKFPLSLTGVDYASLSAHKFHGPKGIGALYVRGDPSVLKPMIEGGGQEHHLRSGTLNVPLIVGMAEAAKIAVELRSKFIDVATSCREIIIEALKDVSDVRFNEGNLQAPHILSVSFLGLEAEALVLDVDSAGYAIGSGSACSSGDNHTRPVLLAMGLEERWARGTVRISFSRANIPDETARLAKHLRMSVEKLRAMRIK